MNKRLKYIDYSKGFAILCMVFAHTMNVEEHKIGIWITSWFMPIFFLICGIILFKKFGGGATPIEFINVLKKRLFQLGIPYIVFCLLLTIFYFALAKIAGEPFDAIKYIIRIIKLDGIDSLWFIPCYFIVEIAMVLLLMIRGNIGKIIRILFAVIALLCILFNWSFPFVLEVECYLFVYIGFLCARFSLIEKCSVWLAIIVLMLCIPSAIYNGAVGLAARIFGLGYLYVINAVFTSIAIISLFYFCEKRKIHLVFFEFYGKNSIIVLCTNNILIETVRLLDHKITGDFLLKNGLWGSVVFTAILIAIEFFVIKLSQTKMGVFFGKNYKVQGITK